MVSGSVKHAFLDDPLIALVAKDRCVPVFVGMQTAPARHALRAKPGPESQHRGQRRAASLSRAKRTHGLMRIVFEVHLVAG